MRRAKLMIFLVALTIVASGVLFNLIVEEKVSFSPFDYCQDSDGGRNYYRAGTVSVEIVGEIEIITEDNPSEILAPGTGGKEILATNPAVGDSGGLVPAGTVDESVRSPAFTNPVPAITAPQTKLEEPSLGNEIPSIGERPRPDPNYNYYYDTCLPNNNLLREYFCKSSGLTHASEDVLCLAGCQSGACVLECGDGIIDTRGGEVCDSNLQMGCTVGGYAGWHVCLPDCLSYDNTECLTDLFCGDGLTDGPEECDDGMNGDDFDECDDNCESTYCGDGIVNGLEECDDGDNFDGDGCSASCVIEYCGDGIANNNSEACDDGDLTDTNYTVNSTDDDDFCVMDSANPGVSCMTNICGDGYLNITSEECDLGLENNDVACSADYDGTCDYCNTTCSFLTVDGSFCGDGFINGPEGCDDGNIVSGDGCSVSCVVETSPPPGGGSGGGGGGGNRDVPEPEVDYLSVVPSELSLSVTKDIAKDFGFVISNSLGRNVEITLTTENLNSLITFEDSSFTIPAEGQEAAIFSVLGTEEQLLAGNIIIKENGETELEIPTVIMVNGIGYLFDAQITIDETSLYSGDELVSQVTLLQVGEQVKLDVTANYVLKDFEGNVYDEQSEMLAVEGRQDYTKRFSTDGLPPGEYVLGLEIVYPDAIAIASDRFKIIERESWFNWWWIAAGIVVILLIVLVFVLWRRKVGDRRIKKKGKLVGKRKK